VTDSPFLHVPPEQWIAANALALAIFDRFPVSPGHALVITRRLVPTWFDASPDEQAAVMALVNQVKQHLDATLAPKPDGYNVGFNAGVPAGQTVMHLHVHVIPRYAGDVPDPRGGVRLVIPHKGNYLATPPTPSSTPSLTLSTGVPDSPLWDQLSCRLLGAQQVDVLASFVQDSGLQVIEQRLFGLLRCEARARILVSDYLYISDARALRRLYDWQQLITDDPLYPGELTVRLIETAKLAGSPASFHPKSWRILDAHSSFIAVGSSNLSRPALQSGVEWNLLSTSPTPLAAHEAFARQYERLWEQATLLTDDVVANYATAATAYRQQHFEPQQFELQHSDPSPTVPDPRPWQVAALASLKRIRQQGYDRALVAVATGMGKTWLAALDARQLGQTLGRRPRVLVIAHRAHILAQAESALACILDQAFEHSSPIPATTAWYIGARSDMAGDLVIASVQKLARPEGLRRLAAEQFDYTVIDEVHHAEAPTYRRVLAQLNSRFILGLTATPERADGVDVASIFDDNLAHHATIGDGIAEQSLVPFHYIGVRDTVDFAQIPWRNGRFDPDELEQRVMRSQRMQRLASALQQHPGQRTIFFCCSRRHAVFARDWLRGQGWSSAAVFSGDGSDSQAESLERLRTGGLQTLCVVDMFNEGLDIPDVDRIVMLRPTESKVIFLQQLGRGLRAAEGKTRLLVIDLVGNHRVFAQRMLHLLSLAGHDASWQQLQQWLDGQAPPLPDGCLLDVELEARDLLRQFVPQRSEAGLATYRALRDALGRRPQAAELYAHGSLPRMVSVAAGSWFQFVSAEGDLTPLEHAALQQFADWFRTVETTRLNKSYKLVVLRTLLDHGQLLEPVDVTEFSIRCRRNLQHHPVLRHELLQGPHALNHQQASDAQWVDWWIQWPITRWLDAQHGRRWFQRRGDTFQLTIDCPPELRAPLEAMTEELVAWRLAEYIRSRGIAETREEDQTFVGNVSHSSGRAILFLPTQEQVPQRPVGPTQVILPDGSEWIFKFVKVACNVARPAAQAGDRPNRLSDLLRQWFGAEAGSPGTQFRVRFQQRDGRWHAEPWNAAGTEDVLGEMLAYEATVPRSAQYTTHLPIYDLSIAAGGFSEEELPSVVGWRAVPDRRLVSGMFIAQVVGRSMEPHIPDGSWCLFEPCPAGSRQGRWVLVQLAATDPSDGGRYTIKRYHSTKTVSEDGWQHQAIELQPLNPDYPVISVSESTASDLRILGQFVAIIAAGKP
jgi:superfamily II DNA or RNA helicase/diadenosine tetraphosphate (Ap4A) HIT family hydrolase/HKD family nuclease/SOS-response transcriptional repressor LexA